MFPGTRNKEWEGMSFRVCQLFIRICLVLWILFICPDHNGTDSVTHYKAVLRVLSLFPYIRVILFQEIFI